MANCKQFQELDIRDKFKNIGILVHLYQNDEESFVVLSSMLRNAENNGKLEGVEILPAAQTEVTDY